MNENKLKLFRKFLEERLSEEELRRWQAFVLPNERARLTVSEVINQGLHSVPYSRLTFEGDKVGEIEGSPVLWIAALGSYAMKADPALYVVNLCHPYKAKELCKIMVVNYEEMLKELAA